MDSRALTEQIMRRNEAGNPTTMLELERLYESVCQLEDSLDEARARMIPVVEKVTGDVRSDSSIVELVGYLETHYDREDFVEDSLRSRKVLKRSAHVRGGGESC